MRIAIPSPKLGWPAGWPDGRALAAATASALPQVRASRQTLGRSRTAVRLTGFLIVALCAAPFLFLAGSWLASHPHPLQPAAQRLNAAEVGSETAAETCFEVQGREGIWWECRGTDGSLSRIGTVPDQAEPRAWSRPSEGSGSRGRSWGWAVTGNL